MVAFATFQRYRGNMKESEIVERTKKLAVLFADIPDDVLMRFVNRNYLICTHFERNAILRALAEKNGTGRESLKIFLCKSVPEILRRKPKGGGYCSHSYDLGSRYEKHISCNNSCKFNPPLPCENPLYDNEYVENAQEVARRDRKLLEKLQQSDEASVRRELLNEAEFNTANADSAAARAEAAFRDGIVRAKLAELEHHVKEQMAALRRENREYLDKLRQEMLRQCGEQMTEDSKKTGELACST